MKAKKILFIVLGCIGLGLGAVGHRFLSSLTGGIVLVDLGQIMGTAGL